MKTSILASCLLALVVSAQPALAQSPKAADKSSSAQPAPVNPAEFDKRLAQAQEHMKQMQAQMDQISRAQDPKERQRLLQEHWTSMQAAMSAMDGMWGLGHRGMGPGMMMGGPMRGWGHMQGYYSQLTPDQLRQRQYMMDQYMPMQQMMMNHMMWHQRWVTQPQPPTK
jgi:hypothetical protein